jgi:hypothetical protein
MIKIDCSKEFQNICPFALNPNRVLRYQDNNHTKCEYGVCYNKHVNQCCFLCSERDGTCIISKVMDTGSKGLKFLMKLEILKNDDIGEYKE